jgi:hypothetical protein
LRILSVYPNPADKNGAHILLGIPYPGDLNLTLYDVRGEVVWSQALSPAGDIYYEVLWDGKNPSGNPVSFGDYYLDADLTTPSGRKSRTGRWISMIR